MRASIHITDRKSTYFLLNIRGSRYKHYCDRYFKISRCASTDEIDKDDVRQKGNSEYRRIFQLFITRRGKEESNRNK